MYLSGSREHTCGDVVINLNSSICHYVSKWFDIFIEILQLLVDHGTKDSFDLALLGKCHINEVESAL